MNEVDSMDAKIVRILEKADKALPDHGILDSYFNASEDRQTKIEDALEKFMLSYGPPSLGGDVQDYMDFLYNMAHERTVAEMIEHNINNVK